MITNGINILVICAILRLMRPMLEALARSSRAWAMFYQACRIYYRLALMFAPVLILWGLGDLYVW